MAACKHWAGTLAGAVPLSDECNCAHVPLPVHRAALRPLVWGNLLRCAGVLLGRASFVCCSCLVVLLKASLSFVCGRLEDYPHTIRM